MTITRYMSIIFFAVIFFISCSQDLPNRHLLPHKSIERLSDSTYFSSVVSNITLYKNNIFLSDCFNSRIICLDSNYNVIRTLGTPGRGPGEFLTPDQFGIINDSLYVYDQSTKKILVFTVDGKYCREFILRKYPKIFSRFAMSKNGEIFVSTPLFEYPITVYDLKGDIKYGVGLKQNDKLSIRERMAGLRHLSLFNDKYIIASVISRPEIEIYSLKGKIVKKMDLSHIDILKDLLNHFNWNKESGGIPSVFSDMSIYQNNLYLLTASFFNGIVHTNVIIKCELNQLNISPSTTYTLSHREGKPDLYLYVGATSNSIISFIQATQSLDIFQF